MKNKLTLLISSCDKFSDIWEIHCKLLEENWSDREIRTILLTDKDTDFNFPNIEIHSTKDDANIVLRLKMIIEKISTKYILITLDDYFLINHVDNDKIENLVSIMEKEKLDYIRLYKYPKSRNTTAIKESENVKILNFKKRYDVNLYPGIWRVDFLKQTLININQNAWEFEVFLTSFAKHNSARCGWCQDDVFPILDSIRKGKFLHKSKKFINNYGYYSGNRDTISWIEEWKLWIMRTINTYLPDKIRVFLKNLMKKRGMQFYSDN